MMASCSPKLRSDPTFSIALFSHLGPRTGSGAVPGTPALPGYCRGIAGTQFTRTYAHLLGFWKLRNVLRPINASMKEAKARRRRRRRRRSRSREARAELYMQSAHSRIDRPRRLTSNKDSSNGDDDYDDNDNHGDCNNNDGDCDEGNDDGEGSPQMP